MKVYFRPFDILAFAMVTASTIAAVGIENGLLPWAAGVAAGGFCTIMEARWRSRAGSA